MFYANNDPIPAEALGGSMRDFRDLRGSDLTGRVGGFYRWQNVRRESGLWPFSRATEEAPRRLCASMDDSGARFRGVNFGSQDYLSLASHHAIKDAAKAMIDEYGVHSAGSSALSGNTKHSLKLEQTVAEFLGVEHAVLYPTGWAAGYGVIRGLVGPEDHVVMDGLSHACLQEGANAATRNVHLHGHLNVDSARRHLRRIRQRDTSNGILVVTEGLFSMDSDTPDIRALQSLCHEYNATLLVDVAHDLGCLGPNGRGHIGLQGMIGEVDLVMGSFSKTFASNGGFVACKTPEVKQYLKFFGSAATFSNALSPVQCATVQKAFEIVQSDEGARLRDLMLDRSVFLRETLSRKGFRVIGDPSAIVPVIVGGEDIARIASGRLGQVGAIANLVEYPAVAKGKARFRLQVMAEHSVADCEEMARCLRRAVDDSIDQVSPVKELVAA